MPEPRRTGHALARSVRQPGGKWLLVCGCGARITSGSKDAAYGVWRNHAENPPSLPEAPRRRGRDRMVRRGGGLGR